MSRRRRWPLLLDTAIAGLAVGYAAHLHQHSGRTNLILAAMLVLAVIAAGLAHYAERRTRRHADTKET